MEEYTIKISHDRSIHHFQAGCPRIMMTSAASTAYLKAAGYVASYGPDALNFLHIFQHTGDLNEGLLYELAGTGKAKGDDLYGPLMNSLQCKKGA